jgi:hypothetical protein
MACKRVGAGEGDGGTRQVLLQVGSDAQAVAGVGVRYDGIKTEVT